MPTRRRSTRWAGGCVRRRERADVGERAVRTCCLLGARFSQAPKRPSHPRGKAEYARRIPSGASPLSRQIWPAFLFRRRDPSSLVGRRSPPLGGGGGRPLQGCVRGSFYVSGQCPQAQQQRAVRLTQEILE